MYTALKHSHILLICISIFLFNWRFWQRTMQPEKTIRKWLKILPHCIDTLLLTLGTGLWHMGEWPLFGAQNWLGIKLILVLLYISAGILCFHSPTRSRRWFISYGFALFALFTIVILAYFKPI